LDKNKEVKAMSKQDKIAIILGIGLNIVVAGIVLFAATNYIA